MTILYPNLCYKNVCYKGTVLYIHTVSNFAWFLWSADLFYTFFKKKK